jgi:hypothetical protein
MSKRLAISKYVAIRSGQISVNGEALSNALPDKEVKQVFRSWYMELGIDYPKFFKMDMLCQLAFIGSEVLLKDADLLENYAKESVAILLSNSSASLDTDRRYHETINDAETYFPSPAVFVYTLPSIMCGEIAIRNGIQGENNLLVSEGFDAEVVSQQVEILFSQTQTEVCITGWAQIEGNRFELLMFLVQQDDNIESMSFLAETLTAIYNR